jgi:hypothetical protein
MHTKPTSRIAILGLGLLAHGSLLGAQQHDAKEGIGGVIYAPEKFDEKTVPWNATLASGTDTKGNTIRQLKVIADLHNISPLNVVKNMSVTVEFFKGGKSLGVSTFTFPNAGLIVGGKKIEHTFDIKEPKYINPAVTIKPLHFDGTVSTSIQVIGSLNTMEPPE